jgi:IS5 family transposase
VPCRNPTTRRVPDPAEYEAFFEPFRAHFDARLGRPSVPIETHLRLMFLKFRYRMGYETLCREVADSISWRRFCRFDIDGRVPHPTASMKITTRCGEATVAALNETLLAKAVAAKVVRAGKSAPTPPWCRTTLSTPPTRAYWPGPSRSGRHD